MLAIDSDVRRIVALRVIRNNLSRLKWHAAALRFELALRKHDRALKYGYDPAQPRVPRGNDGAGEWTAGFVHLAGEIPTNDPPEAPKERPTKSPERSAAAKLAARILGPAATVVEIAKLGAWLIPYASGIMSYNDPPRSLQELQEAVSFPEPGYDIHHIVERNQQETFGSEAINSSENLVLIPRMKHWEINGWYQMENPEFGGQTPREYLSGRNWDVHRSIGLEALRLHGILK